VKWATEKLQRNIPDIHHLAVQDKQQKMLWFLVIHFTYKWDNSGRVKFTEIEKMQTPFSPKQCTVGRS